MSVVVMAGLQSVIAKAVKYMDTGKFMARFVSTESSQSNAELVLQYGKSDNRAVVAADRLREQVRDSTVHVL